MSGENRRWRIDLNTHEVEEIGLPEDWNVIEERRHLTDSHGNRWTGSEHGLDCETHIRSPFALLPMPNNGSTFLHSLMNTPSGILWTGYTDQFVLINADGTEHSRITGKDWSGPAHFTPNAIVMENDGQVLVGMEGQGLWRFNPQTGAAHQLFLDDPHLSVYVLHRQRGRWLAGTSSGVYELRDGEERLRAVDAINKAIPSHYIFGLQTDAEGKTWVGIYGSGIQVFDCQLRHILSLMPPTFPSGAINHLFRDSRNRIWAATCEGVACFSNTHYPEYFEAYTQADGLPTIYINAVGEDSDGRIWVTTNRGLVRWDENSQQFCTYGQQKACCQEGRILRTALQIDACEIRCESNKKETATILRIAAVLLICAALFCWSGSNGSLFFLNLTLRNTRDVVGTRCLLLNGLVHYGRTA